MPLELITWGLCLTHTHMHARHFLFLGSCLNQFSLYLNFWELLIALAVSCSHVHWHQILYILQHSICSPWCRLWWRCQLWARVRCLPQYCAQRITRDRNQPRPKQTKKYRANQVITIKIIVEMSSKTNRRKIKLRNIKPSTSPDSGSLVWWFMMISWEKVSQIFLPEQQWHIVRI